MHDRRHWILGFERKFEKDSSVATFWKKVQECFGQNTIEQHSALESMFLDQKVTFFSKNHFFCLQVRFFRLFSKKIDSHLNKSDHIRALDKWSDDTDSAVFKPRAKWSQLSHSLSRDEPCYSTVGLRPTCFISKTMCFFYFFYSFYSFFPYSEFFEKDRWTLNFTDSGDLLGAHTLQYWAY